MLDDTSNLSLCSHAWFTAGFTSGAFLST